MTVLATSGDIGFLKLNALLPKTGTTSTEKMKFI